jgi:diguanylate cyclase (GGDEF)-like protein/PAS domain S-box-containing protein
MEAVFITAPDGAIYAANPAACQLFGLTEAEICNAGRAGLVYSTSPQLNSFIEQQNNSGKARAELVQIRGDGTRFPTEVSSNQFTDEFGNIRTILIVRDLSKQKQTEIELAESEERFRGAFETTALGMALFSLDGKFVKVNNALCNMLGYDDSELLATDFQTITYPEDLSVDLNYLHQLLSEQIWNFNSEKRYIHKNGSIVWILLSVSIVRTREGVPIHFIAQIQNITERKLAEKTIQKSEANLHAMLDNSPFLTWLKDTEGRYIQINKVFSDYIKIKDPKLAIGKTDQDLNPKELAEKFRADDAEVIASRKSKHVEELGFDGKEFHWIETYKTPVIDANGNVLGTVGFSQDITKRKQIETELRISSVAFESHESMMITDPKGVILRVNKAFSETTGFSAEEAIGKKPNILKSGHHDANFYRAMRETIRLTGTWQGEIWDRRKNGEVYPKWLTISAVKDSNGKVTHYIGSHFDITERKRAEEQIKHLAFYDHLTDLPNRRLLLDRLHQAFVSCGRSGRKGALLFIDLDNFKALNDTHGHDLGDLLLKHVAQRLELCVREGDSVARLGGDEFVVLLEGLSIETLEAAAQAEVIGSKILAALNQPYDLEILKHHNTPSIGITLFNEQQAPEELFKQADLAMYQAKKSGRNNLRFFDPKMQESINARSSIEAELRNSLENNEFHLFYQVQVDSSHQPFGAEALIRWLHPEKGLVPPIKFIPLAEESGLILAIGNWVLETACEQLKSWQQNKATRNLILSINISARQFHMANFGAEVISAVQRYGINPQLLKLELTESILLDEIEETILKMNALKAIGVTISLDDFGTGYSSLQYLKKLPLNQLKIDKSFVRDLVNDKNDRAIAATIIAMAKSLSLDVIAEGVETDEQRAILENAGCLQYQGFLYGKPMPIDKFEESILLISANN